MLLCYHEMCGSHKDLVIWGGGKQVSSPPYRAGSRGQLLRAPSPSVVQKRSFSVPFKGQIHRWCAANLTGIPERAWQDLCFKALPPTRRGFPSLRRPRRSTQRFTSSRQIFRVQTPPFGGAPSRNRLYTAYSFTVDGPAAADPGLFSAWAAHTTPSTPPI